jgi:hypothetical protein
MKRLSKAIASAALGLFTQGVLAQDEAVFNAIDMLHWEDRIFSTTTEYRGVLVDGERVVRARADDSASALYQRRNIDLNRTPYLQWRWRIERTLGSEVNERSHDGDDFAARVYVVRNGGLTFWRARVLNYVWSNSQPVGTRWTSPLAGIDTQMIAVDAGDELAGHWQLHSRDIRADWFAAFGEELDRIDAVAIMTDTDNTGAALQAWYADILFSAQPLPAADPADTPGAPSKD